MTLVATTAGVVDPNQLQVAFTGASVTIAVVCTSKAIPAVLRKRLFLFILIFVYGSLVEAPPSCKKIVLLELEIELFVIKKPV